MFVQLRNHMTGDMMHDALRGTAYPAPWPATGQIVALAKSDPARARTMLPEFTRAFVQSRRMDRVPAITR